MTTINPFIKERAGKISGVKQKEVAGMFLLNIGLWTVDLLLHYFTSPLAEVIFRPVHTLIILFWFAKHTPVPFSARNLLLYLAIFFSVAYPYQANFFESNEIETYLEIILPFISNVFLIIVFFIERKTEHEKRSISEFMFIFLIYILMPAGYYYFVVYQTIQSGPYFTLTIAYTVFFILMMLLGSNLKVAKRNHYIILMGLATMAFVTGLNTYSIFIERVSYGYSLICFLNMFTHLFFLWGFANEDIIKKAGQSN